MKVQLMMMLVLFWTLNPIEKLPTPNLVNGLHHVCFQEVCAIKKTPKECTLEAALSTQRDSCSLSVWPGLSVMPDIQEAVYF